MNFDQIKTFISVAMTKSYSAAAKERYMSQPAISNQIRSLEEELDTVLFTRNTKSLSMTEQGEIFYKYATQLLATEKDIFHALNNEKVQHYGILDIAVPYLTMVELTDKFFTKAIQQKKDEVVYRLLQREDTDIPHMILNGEIELGVANHVVKHKNLIYEEAFVEEIVLITPNAEKYRNLNKEQLRELLLEDSHIRYDFGGI